jgi:acetyltransferase-like isoleucine patch superfamily enzyme
VASSFVHSTAVVAANSEIGADTKIWMNAQVREDVRIGKNCVIGRNVYIDRGARIGDNCKIQNNAMLFAPVVLHDGVFIGPGAILTNDKVPRAVRVDGELKSAADWYAGKIEIYDGASIGAGAILLTEISIGAWAMIGAGALVTKSVGAHVLVVGVPARQVGVVCKCGNLLEREDDRANGELVCSKEGLRYQLGDNGVIGLTT